MAACSAGNQSRESDTNAGDTSLSLSNDGAPSKQISPTQQVQNGNDALATRQSTPIPADLSTREVVETQKPTPTATIPPAVSQIELAPSVDVVVLMGTDYSAPYVGRTDTIILLFADRQTGKASLVSVPRDLLVYKPGHGMDRINTVYSTGGAQLLFDTIEYNFGIRPEHYALAHLDDFIRIVDDLGGIDVMVSTPMPYDCGGIPPGLFHMNGEVALCYVRERQTTSDFDRSRRQQEVLKILFNKFLSLENFLRLPQWYSSYGDSIQSDLGLLDLLTYVPFALHLNDGNNFNFYQIGWDDVTTRNMPETGASVLIGKQSNINSILQQAVGILAQARPTSDLIATQITWLTATPTWTQTITASPTATETWTPAPENDAPAATPESTLPPSATMEYTSPSMISPTPNITITDVISSTQSLLATITPTASPEKSETPAP
jgi:LCP family protein required for cell wall assembly